MKRAIGERHEMHRTARLACFVACAMVGSCASVVEDANEPVIDTSSEAALASGTYTLAPANAPSMVLDIAGVGTSDGTNVQIWSPTGANNQRFNMTDTG